MDVMSFENWANKDPIDIGVCPLGRAGIVIYDAVAHASPASPDRTCAARRDFDHYFPLRWVGITIPATRRRRSQWGRPCERREPRTLAFRVARDQIGGRCDRRYGCMNTAFR